MRWVMSNVVERLSIELSELCSKGCGFCYNGSNREGATDWTADALCAFVLDAAAHGIKAFSFGGGEPLESPELLYPVLAALRGRAFRSMTTNGLLLDAATIATLAAAAIDKVHVSIHTPQDTDEVARVIANVTALATAGIRSGVNLLVRKSRLDAARTATRALHEAGIANQRIVFLPMRGTDVPSPADVAHVAAGPFQSTTCLSQCGPSPRFVSISARRTVAWCSYTVERRRLATPTYAALVATLDGLGLINCDATAGGLVKLATRRPPVAVER
jgi:sulfatase maturation enzyme AslB (radical SAM superfamily)